MNKIKDAICLFNLMKKRRKFAGQPCYCKTDVSGSAKAWMVLNMKDAKKRFMGAVKSVSLFDAVQ